MSAAARGGALMLGPTADGDADGSLSAGSATRGPPALVRRHSEIVGQSDETKLAVVQLGVCFLLDVLLHSQEHAGAKQWLDVLALALAQVRASATSFPRALDIISRARAASFSRARGIILASA